MVVTSLIYLVIQGPGFKYATDSDPSDIPQVASDERGLGTSRAGPRVHRLHRLHRADDEAVEHGHGNHEFLINAASIKAIEDSTNTIGRRRSHRADHRRICEQGLG